MYIDTCVSILLQTCRSFRRRVNLFAFPFDNSHSINQLTILFSHFSRNPIHTTPLLPLPPLNSLGAVHDGSPPPSYLGGPGAQRCRWEDGYIMSDLRHTERGFRWSACTVQSFHHFLK